MIQNIGRPREIKEVQKIVLLVVDGLVRKHDIGNYAGLVKRCSSIAHLDGITTRLVE